MEFVIALITLTFLEIVLGIDNIIFVSIVTNKLPVSQRPKARAIGLGLALIFRIFLLLVLVWVLDHLTSFFFPLDGMSHEQTIEKIKDTENIWEHLKLVPHAFGVREVVLFVGGLFLIGKSVSEVNHKMEGHAKEQTVQKNVSFGRIIVQIVMLDIVFSFDSILTAIGITHNLPAMITAIAIAMTIMLLFSKKISAFIAQYPSLEMLALSFLILVGFMLTLESIHVEVPKGYIYFAVFFSLIIEVINIKTRKSNEEAIKLKRKVKDDEAVAEGVK